MSNLPLQIRSKCISALLALLPMLSLPLSHATAATSKQSTVFLTATVNESQPAIILNWPAEPLSLGYTIYRKLPSEYRWEKLATLAKSTQSWTDSTIMVGTRYEYRIEMKSTISPGTVSSPLVSVGLLAAGIRIPAPDHRGTLIFIVDETMAVPLAAELQKFQEDLKGDGWSVIRHEVARNASTTSVKALIKADYLADPAKVRSVFLFGHVPVPYSGYSADDGHIEHQGAWPADSYYGEMDENWTDDTIEALIGRNTWNFNVPGDGKFDQNIILERELEVGRIDFWNMPNFPIAETELLRRYLNKVHDHRFGLTVLPKRAFLVDLPTRPTMNGWQSFTSMLGAGTVSVGTFAEMGGTESYLCWYIAGAGGFDTVGSVKTSNIVSQDPKAAFTMSLGSNFGDWNTKNNILRAFTGTTRGLASVWIGFDLHNFSLGETLGKAALQYQNSGISASPGAPLIGDPSLRLTAVKPPSGLLIQPNGQGRPVLSWTASPEATLGHFIGRSTNPEGPFVRVGEVAPGIVTWTDPGAPSGVYYYQVKAALLETCPGGSFINTSQAIAQSVTVGSSQNSAPVVQASQGSINLQNGTATLSGSATDSDGFISKYTWTKDQGGTAVINHPNAANTTVTNLTQGSYVFRLNATDNRGLTASKTVNISVGASVSGGQLEFNADKFDYTEGSAVSMPSITVKRVGGTKGVVSVTWTAKGNTSADGAVYESATGNLVWQDGDAAAKTFQVKILGDTYQQSDSSFNIALGKPTGGATLGSIPGLVFKIKNDDTVAPPVMITSISPIGGATTGGTVVTLTGSGFTSVTGVLFGGRPATAVTIVSNTKITCKTPAWTGDDKVSVVAMSPSYKAGFFGGANARGYTYFDFPQISSVTPVNGPTGGGTAVVIRGSGFGLISDVIFERAYADSVAVLSPTEIRCVTPPGSVGKANVSVANVVQRSNDASDAFTYLQDVPPSPPVLSANDSEDTLSASHALGTTAIETSVDNQPFSPYAGPISVGNVVRPAGYWRFRIAAAPGRSASSISNSPAFTLAPWSRTFALWQGSAFTTAELQNPAVSGPSADPEGDGIDNLLEYFLGLNPKQSDPGSSVPSAEYQNGNLVLNYTFDRAKIDLSAVVEQSTDLVAWDSAGVSDVLVSQSGRVETRKATIPMSGRTQFLRLKVSSQ